MVHPAASEIVISPNAILSANALAGLVELAAGPDLKGANATVPQKEEEGQRATASTESGKRRRNRDGSGRRRATTASIISAMSLTSFLDKILDDMLVPLVHPTGNGNDKKRKWIQRRLHRCSVSRSEPIYAGLSAEPLRT
jgi:hypothetical protein